MNLLFFVSDGYREYNSSNFRVSIPASALQRSGKAEVKILGIRQWMTQSRRGTSACSWADIIVLQRVLVEESIEHCKTWTAKGKAVVVDFDDAYDLIRDDNAAYDFWFKGLVDVSLSDGTTYKKSLAHHPMEQFAHGLNYVTGIVTPSRVLCNDWKHYTPAFHLPNYLDPPRYAKFQKRRNDNLTIGWGGSLSHVPSFSGSGVEQALGQLFSENKHIRFLLVGDQRVLERLPIPPDQLIFSNYVKFTEWPGVLKRYDIGLAPLFGKYDCRRSHLKVMEYLALSQPFVATRSLVYRDYMQAESGLFVDQGAMDKCDVANPDRWYDALNMVVNNFEHYKERADKKTYSETSDVDQNVDNILAVYESILERVK